MIEFPHHVEPFATEANEQALARIREIVAKATMPHVLVLTAVLKSALYGRIGEVAQRMRVANLEDDERSSCEIELHNLAQIILEVESRADQNPNEWADRFAVEDLQIIFGGTP